MCKKNYFSNLFSIKSECKSINYMQNNEDPFWSWVFYSNRHEMAIDHFSGNRSPIQLYQWILTYQSININITDMYNLELLSSTIRTYYPRDSWQCVFDQPHINLILTDSPTWGSMFVEPTIEVKVAEKLVLHLIFRITAITRTCRNLGLTQEQFFKLFKEY